MEMENLMPTTTEAYNAVVCGVGYPRFYLNEAEAEQILTACEKAKMAGPLMDKVRTIYCYSAAKNRYAGRVSIVKME